MGEPTEQVHLIGHMNNTVHIKKGFIESKVTAFHGVGLFEVLVVVNGHPELFVPGAKPEFGQFIQRNTQLGESGESRGVEQRNRIGAEGIRTGNRVLLKFFVHGVQSPDKLRPTLFRERCVHGKPGSEPLRFELGLRLKTRGKSKSGQTVQVIGV